MGKRRARRSQITQARETAVASGRTAADSARRVALIAATLGLLTLVVYWPAVHFDFVGLDDSMYVTENPHVRAGLTSEGVAWAFTNGKANHYVPLTWLSHMVDCQLYGLDPGGHHLTNILLHATNAALLFAVLVRMTHWTWASAVVAALFALHPLRIESVAWVAERKDVLSGLFWVLTLWSYARYVERPGTGRYGLVTLSFAAALLAKPMVVTLPLVLLVLDYWPLGRLTRATLPALVREKLPLLAMAGAMSLATVIVAQQGGGTMSWADRPLGARVANALVAYASYLIKTIWPSRLAVFYPLPRAWPPADVLGSALLLGLVSALAIVAARGHPYLLAGWLWFLGTLVPVIGIVQAGDQAMADRFTYVPHIGLFVALVWSGSSVLGRFPDLRPALAACLIVALVALGAASRRQLGYWRDSTTLYTHAIETTTDNWLAHNGLGYALAQQGKTDEATSHFRTSLEINPGFPEALNNFGTMLAQKGLIEEAAAHFSAALKRWPNYATARYNLGAALAAQGRSDEALADFEEALARDPDYAKAHEAIGNLLLQRRRWQEALPHLTEALRLDPGLPDAHYLLAAILSQQGRSAEAAAHYAEAIRLKPDLARRIPVQPGR